MVQPCELKEKTQYKITLEGCFHPVTWFDLRIHLCDFVAASVPSSFEQDCPFFGVPLGFLILLFFRERPYL